jgi:2'-5' RNA ligase
MADYEPRSWDRILSEVDPKDLHDNDEGQFGLENEPHVTLLYGFHDVVTHGLIAKICEKVRPMGFSVEGLSYFDAEDYDVLKFDVESSYARKLNSLLSRLPHTTEFPDYSPHMTVAYLRKGRADSYLHLDRFIEPFFVCRRLRFTNGEGKTLFDVSFNKSS